MVTSVNQTIYNQAKALADAGNVAGAWQVLANAGDKYAQGAYQIISQHGSSNPTYVLAMIADANWKMIAGETQTNQYFMQVADKHVKSYLDTIFNDPLNNYNLPSTAQIEESYQNALAQYNIDPALAAVAYPAVLDNFLGNAVNFTWGDSFDMEGSRAVFNSDVFSNITPYQAVTNVLGVLLEIKTQYGTEKAWEAAQAIFGENALDIMLQVTDYMPALSPLALVTYYFSSDETKTEAILSYFSRFQELSNVNENTLLGLISGVAVESVAADLNISLSALYAKANNTYLADRAVELPNGYSMYLFKDGDRVNITPVDNDANYDVVFTYDPEADNPNSGLTKEGYWGDLLVDITNSSKTAKQALEESPLTSNQPRKAIVTDGSQTEEYQGDNLKSKEAVQNFGGSVNHNDYAETSGGSFTYVKTTATTLIDDAVYLVTEVIDSVISAGTALATFINSQVNEATSWFTNPNGAQIAFAQWLGENMIDIVSGDLETEEAFESLAKFMSETFLGQQIAGALNQTQATQVITDVLMQEFGVSFGSATNIANNLFTAMGRMAVDFALEGGDWDGEDLQNASITAVTSVIAYSVASDYYNPLGTEAGATAAASKISAAVAAAATLVNGLLNSSNYGQTEWILLGVNVGIAAGVAYSAAEIGAAVGTAILPGVGTAVGAVAGVILGILSSDLISSLYKGKVYYEGEYGDLGALLNSIYQVQQVEVSDGNGGTMLVDALVATNGNGSTIIAQAGITHIIGNSGGDVLVGDGGGVAAVDTLIGNEGSDYLEGKQGNDSLVGGNGNDHASGGEGDDYLSGGSGDDLLFGDEGADIILADDGNDFIHGGRQDDTIAAGAGVDLVLGGGGNDTILADDGDDMVDGGAGDDSINGGAGADIILGNLGNDVIEGDDGADVIFGDEGNDSINGGFGNDFIDGGDGVDILQGNNGNDLINGGAGDDYADGGLGDDGIKGGAGADTLLGGMDDDLLYGEDGNDILQGGDGDDILLGGIGSDVLQGGSGDDIYGFDVLSADSDNVIDDESGDNDIISLNWLTETEADANLTLTQDGDDLVINYDGRDIATVTDHFNGRAVEKIEIEQGKIIDLTALTIGTGGVAAFTVAAAGSGESADEKITARIDDITANLQVKEAYWNNGFIQNLSEVAYQEALKDQIENEFYNGSEVTSYYRNRGKFGGKYTIYKLDVAGNIDGTAELQGVEVLETGYNSEEYESIHTGVTEVINNITSSYYGSYNITVKDYWQGSTLLFSVQEFIHTTPMGITQSYQGVYDGAAAEQDGLLFSMGYEGAVTVYNQSQRYSMGTSSVVDVGYRNIQTGADQLVGGFWNEIINGNSGDDILIGNGGDDEINGDAGDDWLFGGDGDDEANGGEGDDTIFGGNGNDTIDGGEGDDSIISGSGDDLIYGQGGNDWIDAGDGIDIIYGGDGDDIIYAGAGDDYAEGGAGIDVIYGQGGNDIIYGNEGTDYLYGGDGNDIIYGVEDEDSIYGDAGNDILRGEGGDDTIYGGEGNDTILGGAGADVINGGDGFDYVSYSSSTAGVIIDLEDSSLNSGGDAEGDVLTNIQAVFGSDYNDYIYGNAELNHLVDRAGNDFIYGRDGNDWLFSVSGTDYFDGGDGSDFLSYQFSGSAVTVSLLANTASGGSAEGDTFVNIENLQGSNYNDLLYGNHNANVLMGKDGNDTLSGQGGNDILYGNAGNDSLWGSADNDTLFGGDGNDMLNGGTENDVLYGEAGNDTLYGGTGDDILYGDAGDDILRGDAGNDIIYSLEGDDDIDGGDGDDTIYASSYGSLIAGGSGTDTLNYTTLTTAITLNLASNTASSSQIGLHSIFGIERIVTGTGNDIIYGSGTSSTLDGYQGDDKIYAGTAGDIIYGGEGMDTVISGAGADIVDGGSGFDYVSYSSSTSGVIVDLADNNLNSGGYAAGDVLTDIQAIYGSDYDDYIYGNAELNHLVDRAGNDFVYGRDGDDWLFSVSGTDYFDGGDGSDFLAYQFSGSAVTVSLLAGTASGGSADGDTFTNIENLQGSNYNDTLYGNHNANILMGKDGNDTLSGQGGNDILYGNAGNDSLWGSADNDTLFGGDGNDMLNGGTENDVLYGEAGSDSLYGGTGDDILYGDADNDYLAGGDGNDFIVGGTGNDNLFGEDGDDTLEGGEGSDTLTGGLGADIFVFSNLSHSTTSARDIITDYLDGTDKVKLAGLAASIAEFSITQSSGNTFITDLDSSFSFQINGLVTLENSDFIFV